MPLGIHNPLPSSMRSTCPSETLPLPRNSRSTELTVHFAGECRKAGKILASFVDPRQAFGPDKIIPPEILAGAKVSEEADFSAPGCWF